MSNARWVSMIAGAGLTLLGLAPAAAQTIKSEPIQPLNEVAGSASYRAYCAACHGIAGKGDGPAAKVLKVPPSDLTQMAARNGGKYPESKVKMSIVGDEAPAAHGSRDMPMWGELFRSIDDRAVAELRTHNLVKYLESIQAKK